MLGIPLATGGSEEVSVDDPSLSVGNDRTDGIAEAGLIVGISVAIGMSEAADETVVVDAVVVDGVSPLVGRDEEFDETAEVVPVGGS